MESEMKITDYRCTFNLGQTTSTWQPILCGDCRQKLSADIPILLQLLVKLESVTKCENNLNRERMVGC